MFSFADLPMALDLGQLLISPQLHHTPVRAAHIVVEGAAYIHRRRSRFTNPGRQHLIAGPQRAELLPTLDPMCPRWITRAGENLWGAQFIFHRLEILR